MRRWSPPLSIVVRGRIQIAAESLLYAIPCRRLRERILIRRLKHAVGTYEIFRLMKDPAFEEWQRGALEELRSAEALMKEHIRRYSK